MSSVKLSVSNQARWGQKLITAYGEYDIAKDGIVEVPRELAEKLLGIPNSYEKGAVEKPKAKPEAEETTPSSTTIKTLKKKKKKKKQK